MEFHEEITPHMQENWFNRINNDNNLYYIIQYEGNDIGLINIKGEYITILDIRKFYDDIKAAIISVIVSVTPDVTTL